MAIKEFSPEGLAYRHSQTNQVHPQSQQQNKFFASGLDRFLREGRILASFKHPNIVRIFRAFKAHGTAYLIMDYEEGEPKTQPTNNPHHALTRQRPSSANERINRTISPPFPSPTLGLLS